MPPILAFIIGVFCCELAQFGVWWGVKPGSSPRGYLTGQIGHYATLLGIGGMFVLLWTMNGLDVVVQYLPEALTGSWAKTGVPFTPQVGAVMGFLLSLRIDKIIGAFKARFQGPVPAGQ